MQTVWSCSGQSGTANISHSHLVVSNQSFCNLLLVIELQQNESDWQWEICLSFSSNYNLHNACEKSLTLQELPQRLKVKKTQNNPLIPSLIYRISLKEGF